MKRYLCLLLIVLMSFSLVLVSCSPEAETEEKKETYTAANATEVATDVGTAGLSIAKAVNTLSLKTQPCTLTVDIASTTDSKLDLGSTPAVAPSPSQAMSLRSVDSSTDGYHEIKLTYDIGAATTKGLNQIASKLAEDSDFETFKRNAAETEKKLADSDLYNDFKNLFSGNELSFKGSLLTRILSVVRDCAPEIKIEILVGENGKNGKLSVNAGLSGSGSDIRVKVVSAVLADKDGKTIMSSEGAEFSVAFDDDFDVVLKIDGDSISFVSVKGGVTVSVDKMDVKTNYLVLSEIYGVAGSFKWDFTTKKLDASLAVKGGKLEAGFKVKAELTDKDTYVSSLVEGLEITKLSFDGTDFDAGSVNTVLKTRKTIIIKALKSYLDGSAISSLTTVLK